MGYGPQTTRTSVVKAVPARLQCAALYRPWAVRVGLCTALPPPQLYVALRPHAWQGARPARLLWRRHRIADKLLLGSSRGHFADRRG